MITKNTVKLVQSLKQQKYRKEHQLFVVEGRKMVQELLASDFETIYIFATASYMNSNTLDDHRMEIVSDVQMEQMSGQNTAPGILAVAKIPHEIEYVDTQRDITLALDGISNPGNMGTIIRTAEWFGIKNITCSSDCVEVWNPKVIQATMGSIFRVKAIETDLESYLTQEKANGTPIYGTLLNGKNLYTTTEKWDHGIIVIGSESHGIRENLLSLITVPITIPRFSGSVTESLNAAVATGIVLSHIRSKV